MPIQPSFVQRIKYLRRERDRLSISIVHRKSSLTNKLLTQEQRGKIIRQISTKTKLLAEINQEISRLIADTP